MFIFLVKVVIVFGDLRLLDFIIIIIIQYRLLSLLLLLLLFLRPMCKFNGFVGQFVHHQFLTSKFWSFYGFHLKYFDGGVESGVDIRCRLPVTRYPFAYPLCIVIHQGYTHSCVIKWANFSCDKDFFFELFYYFYIYYICR